MSLKRIGSSKALEIIREVRPRASRGSLKALVDRGLITVEPIHARRFAYDADEVKSLAARLAEVDQL